MKKKLRVYQEEAKTRHTAHWDWDYLTWQEIEQRLKQAGVAEAPQVAQNRQPHIKRWSRLGIWIGLGLLVVVALLLVVMITW
jgi:hypothetical protein